MLKLVLLVGIFCTSCHLDSSRRIIKDINKRPEVYAGLVSKIKYSDSIKSNGTLININEVPSNILNVLDKTVLRKRFRYLSVDILGCGDKSIELIIDNNYLIYSSCPDSTFPIPGSYEKVGFIESWGINENWYLWKDNDPI